MTETRKPTALIILDGWGGHRDPAEDNAISNANTPPFWDKIWQNQPKTLINTSGMFVGLPPQGQMGNSEVGHMNLGAGRVVYQSLTRIDKDLEDGDFQKNEALCNAIDKAVANGKAVHLMGLLSPGGVHSMKIIFWRPLSWLQPVAPKKFTSMLSSMAVTCHHAVPALLWKKPRRK